ncbi:hypothetical protein K501DRAFT_268318 [Backusella circina FSU 941]|nr:hypothetical protein K501DRAFT_268318 [Backusella circina FSU 941]
MASKVQIPTNTPDGSTEEVVANDNASDDTLLFTTSLYNVSKVVDTEEESFHGVREGINEVVERDNNACLPSAKRSSDETLEEEDDDSTTTNHPIADASLSPKRKKIVTDVVKPTPTDPSSSPVLTTSSLLEKRKLEDDVENDIDVDRTIIKKIQRTIIQVHLIDMSWKNRRYFHKEAKKNMIKCNRIESAEFRVCYSPHKHIFG